MDIRKLLNPLPNKKSRFDEDALVCDKYWLPTELIAYVMTFFHFKHRPELRLVSKKWYTAYDLYHRNKEFNDYNHIITKPVTRRQLLNAFVKYGHRLRLMYIHTSILRELLSIEPNFTDLIPNVTRLRLTVDDGFPTQRWMCDFVAKLCTLIRIVIEELGSTADEHLADEMDKAVLGLPHLRKVDVSSIDLDSNSFPGPNMKVRASQIVELKMSLANIEPGTVVSAFEVFKNVEWLGLSGISSVGVLKEVTEIVINEKNFPAMYNLDVCSQLDLSHASPIANEEDGSKVTAMDLYLKICGIRRPNFELHVGFILGACSKNNSELIERERDFVISLGKAGSGVLSTLELTHHTPVGDYDPLTTLFYENAPRFPNLLFLEIHASPTAITGPRIIDALNNPFLLPHLIAGYFYVDGTQSPEWNGEYDPIDPSRGIVFSVLEADGEDEVRMLNETNDGVLPFGFFAD